jgi:streptogramin lyase
LPSPTSGYGPPTPASTSLLLSTGPDTILNPTTGNYYVTTNATGGFTIGVGDYACGTGSPQQVYLYAIGGNPQVGGDNAAAGLMAVLGQCTANTFSGLPASIQMDEVTTVAAAYALAGYAGDATHMSGSNSALAAQGMKNAALSAANLADLGTGFALTATPNGNGSVPQSEINTLANILASCINSSGPGSSACTTLFSDAMNGSTAPIDTATAAINIAHNPGVNVAALWSLSSATAPFQPSLSSAPNDWTIGVTYTGGGMTDSGGLAVDGSGDIWVANFGNYHGVSISELNPVGTPLSGSGFTGGGLDSPDGIAIDASGNVWLANFSNNSLSKFSSLGVALSGSGYTGGGLNDPSALAIDTSGNVWVTNFNGPSLSKFSSLGVALSGSGYTGGGLSGPYGVAVSTSGDVWIANLGTVLSRFDSSGSPVAGSPYSGGDIDDPLAVAIDASGNIWLADYTPWISEFSSSGIARSPSNGYTGGGVDHPGSIAIDGVGNVWLSNANSYTSGGGIVRTPGSRPALDGTTYSDSVTEFDSSGNPVSPSTAYLSAGFNDLGDIVVDGSGNVWVSDINTNSLTELVGAAAPVVTPLVTAVANHQLGTRP